jgi:hypothetical protein
MNECMVVEVDAEPLINIIVAIVRANNSKFGKKLCLEHRMEGLKE